MQAELAEYIPPKERTIVCGYGPGLSDVMDDGYFGHTASEVRQLGFKYGESYPTKRGHWEIFERFNHQIPNFPTGETTIHSMLALYDGRYPGQHAVLRTSLTEFQWSDFRDVVRRVSDFYIERPAFPRFPIRDKDIHFGPWFMGAILTGAGVGLATFIVPGGGEIPTSNRIFAGGGGLILAETSKFLSLGINKFRERALKRKLGPLSEYSVGRDVSGMLSDEQSHTISTLLKREMYEALVERGVNLEPEGFLKKVYRPLSYSPLLGRRSDEIRMEMLRPARSRVRKSTVKEKLMEAAVPLAA